MASFCFIFTTIFYFSSFNTIHLNRSIKITDSLISFNCGLSENYRYSETSIMSLLKDDMIPIIDDMIPSLVGLFFVGEFPELPLGVVVRSANGWWGFLLPSSTDEGFFPHQVMRVYSLKRNQVFTYLSIFNLLSDFFLVQRISNYYPNYPTHRLYFGKVETPCN